MRHNGIWRNIQYLTLGGYERMKFTKKLGNCIVIGGKGVVGREICSTMRNHGWNVIIISRSSIDPDEINHDYIYKECDASLEVDFSVLIDELEYKYGPIDVLINCACVRPMKDFFHDSIDTFKDSITINSLSLFVPSKVVGIKMTQRKNGSIINVSSIYGMRGPKQNIYKDCDFETEPDYVYTKSGSIGLTKYLASYYADRDVRVNAVVLGGVENNQPEGFKKLYNDRVPMGRMCKTSEIGGVFAFLASNDSTYITGSVICVDGGWTAT